jgi:hypothetical protein
MQLSVMRLYVILAAIFLTVNESDFVTTLIGIVSGRGVEANPSMMLLGGPLSPAQILVKLVVGPTLILGLGYVLAAKFRDARITLSLIVPTIVAFSYAVANNVLVCIAGKKIEKENSDNGGESA